MIAKKLKEMLTDVPDHAKIIVTMEDTDGYGIDSEVLNIYWDEEYGEYSIQCRAWDKESPEDTIERLEAEKEAAVKKHEALKASFEELEKQYSTFTTAMAARNGWDLPELQQAFAKKFFNEKFEQEYINHSQQKEG